MKKQIDQVNEFNKAFNVTAQTKPNLQPMDIASKRANLILEELLEFQSAVADKDLTEVADALVDMTYLIFGAVHEYGLQDCFVEMFDEVHRTNMAKLHNGQVVKNAANKVMKPEGWQPPNLELIINKS